MAYAQPRSCNADLYKGATEGGERQALPNRGGVVTSPPNDGWYTNPMRCTIRSDHREECNDV